MHRVWTIPELLQLIFAHLGGLERNVALARLARVNRQVSATAIPLLWKTLQNTTPLAGLLTGCYDKEFLRKLKEGEDNAIFSRLLKSSHLRRFETYAPLIKGLISRSDQTFSSLWPLLYEAQLHISRNTPGTPLLPRLSYLSWDATTTDSLRAFLCFVNPSITELKFGLGDAEQVEDLPLVVERIQAVSPSILNFTFCWEEYTDLQTLTRAVTCLVDLLRSQRTTLQKVQVDMTVIMEAARKSPIAFPVLEHLDCRVGLRTEDESTSNSVLPIFSTEHFPRLQTLNGRFEQAFDLLDQDRLIGGVGVTLTEIHIAQVSDEDGVTHEVGDVILGSLLATIGRSCPNLRKFGLHGVRFALPLESWNNFLQPLYNCARLEELVVSAYDGIDISYCLTNHDIIEMTQAWKGLKVLRIFSDDAMLDESDDIPHLDLDAIEILVSQCSQLRDISLAVNATTHQAFSDRPRPRWNHALESIDFGNSPINDSGNIAIWLNNLCPWSSISFHDRGDDDPIYKTWCEVKAHVRCLQRNNQLEKAEVQELRNEIEELRTKLDAALKNCS